MKERESDASRRSECRDAAMRGRSNCLGTAKVTQANKRDPRLARPGLSDSPSLSFVCARLHASSAQCCGGGVDVHCGQSAGLRVRVAAVKGAGLEILRQMRLGGQNEKCAKISRAFLPATIFSCACAMLHSCLGRALRAPLL